MDEQQAMALLAGLGVFALVLFLVLIAVYIISSLGWYKVYKTAGYDQPWFAWVPILSTIAMAKFFQTENEDPEWFWCVMGFYWALAFIPVIGTILVFAGGVFCFVNEIRYLMKKTGGPAQYLTLIFVPVAFPYTLIKYYR